MHKHAIIPYSHPWTVSAPEGAPVAATSTPEAAARVAVLLGEGATVRYGRQVVWYLGLGRELGLAEVAEEMRQRAFWMSARALRETSRQEAA